MDLLSDHTVEHLRDHFGPDTSDEEWLPWVGQTGRILLTRDLHIARRPGERRAMVTNGVRAFLIGGKGKDRFAIFASVALSWRAIEKFAAVLEPPT